MTTKTFDSLGLGAQTLKAIKRVGFITPMPVQAEVIPLVLQGRDALVSARTGSGKTAAFTIPILDILHRDTDGKDKCLIVAPTRELAEQIHKVFTQLATNHEGIKSALIVGGKHFGDQIKKLKKDPRFIIGTPGRINDHVERKSLDLSTAKYVVWDETDRMLALGFIHQIERIMSFLPAERQSLMLSATFPARIAKLAQKYLNNPVRVEVDAANSVSQNITQRQIYAERSGKLDELKKLINTTQGQIIVFCKTQKQVDFIYRALSKEHADIQPLHGGLRQVKRSGTMRAFREGRVRVLVATDVAARGLDITGLALVVNYELPQEPEEYIHRIGRTGRVNAKGLAISLLATEDKERWRQIQEFLKGNEVAAPIAKAAPRPERLPAAQVKPNAAPKAAPTPQRQIKKKFGFKLPAEQPKKDTIEKKKAPKKYGRQQQKKWAARRSRAQLKNIPAKHRPGKWRAKRHKRR